MSIKKVIKFVFFYILHPVFCELSGYSAVLLAVLALTELWSGFAKHTIQSVSSSTAVSELSKFLKFLLNDFDFDQKILVFLSWEVKNASKMCYVFEVWLLFVKYRFCSLPGGNCLKFFFASYVTTILSFVQYRGLKSIWQIKKLFKVLPNNFGLVEKYLIFEHQKGYKICYFLHFTSCLLWV